MRALFDVVHPAHVHFYRYLREALLDEGHEALVVARTKDVTETLLDEMQIPYERGSGGPREGRLGQAAELAARVAKLHRLGRRFRPDVLLTRNPAGAIAARTLGIPGIFDTDDGRNAGIHFALARPAATVITTPTGMGEHYGRRHREYPSYKALAFLHPDRFRPDPGIAARLGVGAGDRYSVVRIVAMHASHDHGHIGLTPDAAAQAIDVLGTRGPVFVSAEGALPDRFARHRLPTKASEFHSVLAGAQVCVGDSGSVAAEAALLGTPSIVSSTYTAGLPYLRELEERYGLVRRVEPGDPAALIAQIERVLDDPQRTAMASRRDEMLADKIDLTQWYLELIQDVVKERG